MQLIYQENLTCSSNVKSWLFSSTDAFGMGVLGVGMCQKPAVNSGVLKSKGINRGACLLLDS